MKGGTHLTIGIASGLGYALALRAQPDLALLITGIAAVGALLPDIDHPQSMVSNRMGIARAPLFWLSHRGITHSALIVCVIILLGQTIDPVLTQAFSFGYSSHIMGDMLTKAGVPLLWPMQTRFRLLPRFLAIRGGGLIEVGIFLLAVLVCFSLASQLVFGAWL